MIFKKGKARGIKIPGGLKVAASITGGILAFLYVGFLAVPLFVDVEKFVPQINDELKSYTRLELELINPKLKTTPLLRAGLKADKIALKYNDGRDFAAIEHPVVEINLPTLIFKRLNLDKIYAKDVNVLLVFDKDKKYTIMDYFIEQPATETGGAPAELPVAIRNINIIADNINFTIEDKVVNKDFKLHAKETRVNLASLEGPVKFKTVGDLSLISDSGGSKKFVDFDVNLFVRLPKLTSAPHQEPVKIEPFNPFVNLDQFNFKSKIVADLKLNDLENFNARGYVKVSETSLKVDSLQLPESFLNADFAGNEIKVDTNLYLTQSEFLNSKSTIQLGKNPKIDLSAKTEKLSLNNIFNLANALCEIFNAPNDFKDMTATGVITADFDLKSDMKKVQSKGNLKLQNGSISYPKMSINLTQIGSLLDFDDNKLSIKNTSANLNGSKFSVNGEILSNTNLKINVHSDPLPIAQIIKLGESLKVVSPKDLADFIFTGGLLTITADVGGNLNNPLPRADVAINNLAMKIKSANLPLNISKIDVKMTPNKKDFDMNIDVMGVSGTVPDPKMALAIQNMKITGDSKNLTLPPFNAVLEGTNAEVKGTIGNWAVNPKLDFIATGAVAPPTILAFLPPESRSFVKFEGKMPFSGTLTGFLNDMNIVGTVESSPANYVNVVDVESLRGQTNKIAVDVAVRGAYLENLIINNISVPKAGTVKGTILNYGAKVPTLSGLNISVPQRLNISAPAFDNVKLGLTANLNISGSALNPSITGNCAISNLVYPPVKLNAQNANIDFKKSTIAVNASGINIGKSDFSGDLAMSSDFSKTITINDMKFNSKLFDSDELLKILNSMPNTQTTAGPSADLVIKSGRGNIARLTSGAAVIENIAFDFTMAKDIFKITNLTATAYEGSATGTIDYNIATLKADIDMTGKNINVRSAGKAFTGVAMPLSGRLNGLVKVSMTGETYEQQMRTLVGMAKFDVTDGEMKNFIRFENFLYAGNILSQNFLGFNLNNVVSAVNRVDTGVFKTLNGTISFAGGWANIQEFKSSGPNMSLFANGKYNLLTNVVDMKVLGKISPRVVDVLGPVGNFSVNSILNKLPEKGQEILGIVKSVAPSNPLMMQVSPGEISKIPDLSTTSSGTNREFQVMLNGPAESTKSVKSFRWITDQTAVAPETSSAAVTGESTPSTTEVTPTTPGATTTPAAPAQKPSAIDLIPQPKNPTVNKILDVGKALNQMKNAPPASNPAPTGE